jgi:hypothetical protein
MQLLPTAKLSKIKPTDANRLISESLADSLLLHQQEPILGQLKWSVLSSRAVQRQQPASLFLMNLHSIVNPSSSLFYPNRVDDHLVSCGDDGARTRNLVVANHALSQLSYTPAI